MMMLKMISVVLPVCWPLLSLDMGNINASQASEDIDSDIAVSIHWTLCSLDICNQGSKT